MAPLLNAKAWFKRRRGKKRNGSNPHADAYIPGIGYPPMRNSSQPTLIPYIPPSGSSSNSSEHEDSLETVTQEMMSAATTTCLGISTRSAALLAAAAASAAEGANPGPGNDYHDDYCRRYQENNQSAATLVPSPSFPTDHHRHASLQPPAKPFAIALSAHQKNSSHTSLPAQLLPGDILTDLRTCPNLGQNGRITPQRNCESPQPLQPLNNLKSSRFAASAESLSVSETKAQEYARTVKTVWQMVEDKDLAYRLADCSPVEREWLIFNHKNANFPLKPAAVPSITIAAAPITHEGRGRTGPSARGVLARIDESVQCDSFTHPPKTGRRSHENSDGYLQPTIKSLPNSPVSGPVDSSDPMSKRSTLLSPMVLQSARELQKRDHITIQQRVDMEESWRMQARLRRGQGEQEERARGVRRVHEQLLQRQKKQREYEPTHKDFNKWYDLKEEVDDDDIPDLNDDLRGYDLKEEFEDEEEKKQRELEEKEAKKKKELEDLEQELELLGLDRFDGMCMSFVESDEARVPQMTEPVQVTNPEETLVKQQLLHQQLQYQYQQLQLQLALQRQKTIRSRKARARARKNAALALVEPISAPNILPPPVSAVPAIPGNKPPKSTSKLIVLPPKTAKPTKPTTEAPVNKMVLHEPRPLQPRNGRKLFSNECCDSMIIKDMPMLVSAPARIH
ncbi:hypothetical protein BGX27_010721 [Mortierella sp. AM989]|nr:hypothetical protein BGX27_010721 [Mortierella sp. AM989]